jgi:tRNA (guanine37-N1)-methyltransferase
MQIEVVTLFPPLIEAGLAAGVVGRAVTAGVLRVGTENPRSHATDLHRTVDDRPFGGGPGMVLKPEPLAAAIRAIRQRVPAGAPVIGLSAQGATFAQATARRLAGLAGFGLVAGRYEGIDQRVAEALIDEELSIGDYVLSGGELPALVVIDAVARLLPGVLGHDESAEQDSFADGLLDWPHYTRPENWEGRPVPEVLAGGNHAAIRRWRLMQALGRTWRLRPDLLRSRSLTCDERALLEEYCAGAGIEPPR